MKNIIYVIFCLCFIETQAQDPQLFENTWYLQKVVVEDIDYSPPGINGEGNIVTLELDESSGELITSICNAISGPFTYSSSENLITVLGDWFIFGIECENNENLTFANLYYNHIWNLNSNQSFDLSYLIENEGNKKTLTITNTIGNQAIYGNVLLDVVEFENSSFKIYPNPVDEVLLLHFSSNTVNGTVTVYDALGSVVFLQNRVTNTTNSINLAHLPSGIYFVQVVQGNQKNIKKFVKR